MICLFRSDCASPDLSLRWITDNSSLCLSVNSIAPSLAQTGEDIEVGLFVCLFVCLLCLFVPKYLITVVIVYFS